MHRVLRCGGMLCLTALSLVLASCGARHPAALHAGATSTRLGLQPAYGTTDMALGPQGRVALLWRDAILGRGSCPRGFMLSEGSLVGRWTRARQLTGTHICEPVMGYLADGRLLAGDTRHHRGGTRLRVT